MKEFARKWGPLINIGLAAFLIWYGNKVWQRRQEELKEYEAYKIQEAKEINAKLKIERAKAERAEAQTVETGVAPLP